MQFRIGDRDPVTGLYYVIWPDDSTTLNGIKNFNAASKSGDLVQATRRSDGLIVLDGPKADVIAQMAQNSQTKLTRPSGYLNGQVFNDEEEILLPSISIDLAPNSPTLLDRSGGNFTVRISLNRKQSRDMKFKLDFSGSAIYASDYSTFFNPSEKLTIDAGQQYKDFVINPVYAEVDFVSIISVGIKPSRDYRVINSLIELTLVPIKIRYLIGTRLAETSPFSYVVKDVILNAGNRDIYEAEWLSATQATPLPQFNFYSSADLQNDPELIGDGWPLRLTSYAGISANFCVFSVSGYPQMRFFRQDRRLPPSF